MADIADIADARAARPVADIPNVAGSARPQARLPTARAAGASSRESEVPGRVDQGRAHERRRPQVEPDGEPRAGEVGRSERQGAPSPPGLEGDRGHGRGEQHRHVGAGDAAVEDERRRDRGQPGEGRARAAVEAGAGPQRQQHEQGEPGDQHGEAHQPLRQGHAGVHQQPVERGQGDAVVGKAVGDQDLPHRHGQGGAQGVQLVAPDHLGGQVPKPQQRAEGERGQQEDGGSEPRRAGPPRQA